MSCAPGARMLPGGRLQASLRKINGSYTEIEQIVVPGHAYGNHNGTLVEEGVDGDGEAQRMDLFVVDSGNRGVDPSLVPLRNQVIFEQSSWRADSNSTELELLSLQHAADILDFSGYSYVIKLTAKYKLDTIALPSSGFDVVAQAQHEQDWQNSEFIAMKASRFSEFIQRLSSHVHAGTCLERRLWKLVHEEDVRFTRLPPQHNHARYRRGAGDYLQRL